MAELSDYQGKKIVAFYLPQFHTIPENDKWWGVGFTEWTNTKKTKPLFEGHYQPRVPLNNNYYDLSDVNVMKHQTAIAKEYGIYGFCYYHYWFKNGKKLLEKPVEQMLKDRAVDMPFCLCWANENWTRNWDGGDRSVIAIQDYGHKKEWIDHFMYLLPFFEDKRYITYEGKPVFVIYKPEQIRSLSNMISCWRELSIKHGLPGLVILRQHPGIIMSELDYTIKFQPQSFLGLNYRDNVNHGTLTSKFRSFAIKLVNKYGSENFITYIKKFAKGQNQEMAIKLYDYDDAWEEILENEVFGEKFCSCGFVSWDNTPRKRYGVVFAGATPEKFGDYMGRLLRKPSAMNLVFINAWNEWAEGAYLEPDVKNEFQYLSALKGALVNNGDVT